jgi:ankyrin repeat protein
MATKPKVPKKVLVLTAKLRTEYDSIKNDSNKLIAFMQTNNIDANAMRYKRDKYSTYDLYLFFDPYESGNLSIEVFKYFIDNGADLSLTGYNGGTVLQRFLMYRNIEKIELALKHGAPPNAKDNDGNTAINELIRDYGDGKVDTQWDGEKDNAIPKDFEKRLQYIELLLKYGADPTIKNNYGDCAIDWIQERKNEGFDDDDNKKLESLIAKYAVAK